MPETPPQPHTIVSAEDVAVSLSRRDGLAVDRTVMANERTLLAWVRTGLTFLAAGLTFIQFFSRPLAVAVGWIFIPIGLASFVLGFSRYLHFHRKIRQRS